MDYEALAAEMFETGYEFKRSLDAGEFDDSAQTKLAAIRYLRCLGNAKEAMEKLEVADKALDDALSAPEPHMADFFKALGDAIA